MAGEFGYMMIHELDLTGNIEESSLNWNSAVVGGLYRQYNRAKLAGNSQFKPVKDASEIMARASMKEPEAMTVMAKYYQDVAVGLINLIGAFDPEVILVGGGISANKEFMDKLTLTNEDLEGNAPESYTRFCKEMKEQDAYVFITPEYNCGMPASLKNAIDVGSVSPSGIAGALANHQIRQSLVFGDSPVMAQPELYIDASKAIGEDGQVVSGSVGFLQTIADAFVAFIDKNSK